jgi:dCTP deaminase
MILTGDEIRTERASGKITIDPFDDTQLNPNSYNYRLAPDLRVSADAVLDASEPGKWRPIRISEEGIILEPHTLYLGSTVELIGSPHYVASLIGRSSLGRLGMFLQASADLGNLGAIHCWTLEIKVVQRLRIYANMLAGQVSFWRPQGNIRLYSGVYDGFSDATPSQRQHRLQDRV